MPFEMQVGEHDGVLVVRLVGRFEAPCADEVRRELLRRGPPSLRIDLSGLATIDAQGLAALVAIRHDVVSGSGRILVHGATDAIRATLAAAGLDALVDEERAGDLLARTRDARPVTRLATKGGRHARRTPVATAKVA